MESVSVTRVIQAAPAAVRERMNNVGPFMRSAGFDAVTVEDDEIRVVNHVGLASIELTVALVDHPDSELAYEQRHGIFEEMQTIYAVTEVATGTEVTARTEFSLDVFLVGDLLDTTIIKRQRRRELSNQLAWLENQFTG